MEKDTNKLSDLAKSICAVIDISISYTTEYLDQTQRITSKKNLQSSYYAFCVKLLSVINKIDDMTNDISHMIISLDMANDIKGITYANSLCDRLIFARVTFQEFLESGEKIIKNEELPYLSSALRKEVDILTRKIILSKDEFKKYF